MLPSTLPCAHCSILVIRICLFLAYTWLLTAACVGYPQWPNIKDGPSGQPGFISLDGIIWWVGGGWGWMGWGTACGTGMRRWHHP